MLAAAGGHRDDDTGSDDVSTQATQTMEANVNGERDDGNDRPLRAVRHVRVAGSTVTMEPVTEARLARAELTLVPPTDPAPVALTAAQRLAALKLSYRTTYLPRRAEARRSERFADHVLGGIHPGGGATAHFDDALEELDTLMGVGGDADDATDADGGDDL